MRIDAYAPGFDHSIKWVVWHVEQCRSLNQVIWVDDDLHQWCQYVEPIVVIAGSIQTSLHQARKILIVPSKALVLINPIDDAIDQDIEETMELVDGAH